MEADQRVHAPPASISLGVLGAVRLVEVQDRVRRVRSALGLHEQPLAGCAHAVEGDVTGDEVRWIGRARGGPAHALQRLFGGAG